MTDSIEIFGELVSADESDLIMTAEDQAAINTAKAEVRKRDVNDVDSARLKGRAYAELKAALGHGKYGVAIENERRLWVESKGADGMRYSQKTAEKYSKLHDLWNTPELNWVWKEYITGRNLGIEDAVDFCTQVLKGADPHELFASAFTPKVYELGEGATCVIDPEYTVLKELVDLKHIHPEAACKIIERCKELNDPRVIWAGRYFGFRDTDAVDGFYNVLRSETEARNKGFDVNDLCGELDTAGMIELENGDQIELWKARKDEIWNAYAKVRREKGAQKPKSVKAVNKKIPYDTLKRIVEAMGDDELLENILEAPQGVTYTIVVTRARLEGEL